MLNPLRMNGKYMYNQGLESMKDCLLQALIDVIYAYSKKWHFEANVAKCAVVVFRNEKELDGTWTWRNSVLPHLNYYTYLGVNFTL